MAREALAYGDNFSAVIRMAKETIWHPLNTSNSLVRISIAAETSKNVYAPRSDSTRNVYMKMNASPSQVSAGR